jgi:hypothetical protein
MATYSKRSEFDAAVIAARQVGGKYRVVLNLPDGSQERVICRNTAPKGEPEVLVEKTGTFVPTLKITPDNQDEVLRAANASFSTEFDDGLFKGTSAKKVSATISAKNLQFATILAEMVSSGKVEEDVALASATQSGCLKEFCGILGIEAV